MKSYIQPKYVISCQGHIPLISDEDDEGAASASGWSPTKRPKQMESLQFHLPLVIGVYVSISLLH